METVSTMSYSCDVINVRNNMVIKQSILDKVNNPQSRTRIAVDLGGGEASLAVQMRLNNDNGRLTKMDALQAISKEAGVPVEEILEESTIKEGQGI